jgi:hypothetical protein
VPVGIFKFGHPTLATIKESYDVFFMKKPGKSDEIKGDHEHGEVK